MSPFILSIYFVVFGQFLNAAIVLIDKYIITRTAISKPAVYAFYVGMISSVVIVLVPFGLIHTPTYTVAILSIVAGFSFIASIFFLFSALKNANATDAVAWLAAVSTVATFLLGFFVLNEELPKSFPAALILLLIGMALVGHFRFHAKSFLFVVVSGILFGLSAILIKILFNQTTFLDGFFWSRMGNVFGALVLMMMPGVKSAISDSSKKVSPNTTFLVILNRILGGIAFLAILYAIRIGSVSIVNSLASLQFVFVFLLVFLLAKQAPHLYAHEFRKGHIFHKVLAALFIVSGFFVLFL